jgi:hypothetical protein
MTYHVDNLSYLVQKVTPLVYDDSLSLYELVDKVCAKLNEVIDDTNDYFSKDLKVYVGDILTGWYNDGTLSTIINQQVFGDITSRLSTLETDRDTTNMNLTNQVTKEANDVLALQNSLAALGINVKDKGAKGDYVSDGQRGTDDTSAFQTALNLGGIIHIPKGQYYIAGQLDVKSNTRIVFSPDAVLHTYSSKAFNLGVGVNNVRIEQASLTNHFTGGTSYAYYLKGDYSNGYASTVNNVALEQGVPVGYSWALYMENARKVTVLELATATRNGVQYTGRSAECVIRDCNFIQYDDNNLAGTKGLSCIAGPDGYPEGLTVDATLFYHYEHNLYITDMYVGKFHDLYFDCGANGCLENIIQYNQRTQFLEFDKIWTLNKGFIIGTTGQVAPQEFRMSFSNITLDFLTNHGFTILDWARSLEFNNIKMYGNGVASVAGFILNNQNNFVRINGYTGRFTAGFIQVYGNSQFVEGYAISNFDSTTNMGVYTQASTITVNGTVYNAMG